MINVCTLQIHWRAINRWFVIQVTHEEEESVTLPNMVKDKRRWTVRSPTNVPSNQCVGELSGNYCACISNVDDTMVL